jgi:hypothetical protein
MCTKKKKPPKKKSRARGIPSGPCGRSCLVTQIGSPVLGQLPTQEQPRDQQQPPMQQQQPATCRVTKKKKQQKKRALRSLRSPAGPAVSGTTAPAFEPPPLTFWPPNRRRSRSGLGTERTIRTAACSRSGQGGAHPRVQHDGPAEQRLDLPDVRQGQLVPPWLLHRWPGPVLEASRSDLGCRGIGSAPAATTTWPAEPSATGRSATFHGPRVR